MNEIEIHINDGVSISMDEEQYYEYVDYMYELEVDRRLEKMEENAHLQALLPDIVKVLHMIIDASDLYGFDPGEILAGIEEAAEVAEEILDKLGK